MSRVRLVKNRMELTRGESKIDIVCTCNYKWSR